MFCALDKFTDSAIAMNSKVNGEHKEKVLQRWEGGDSNSDDYDLESDMVIVPLGLPWAWLSAGLKCLRRWWVCFVIAVEWLGPKRDVQVQ